MIGPTKIANVCGQVEVVAKAKVCLLHLFLDQQVAAGAQEVQNRVCNCVANDGEQPAISLSAGFAIYPRDGETAENLMDAADHALYQMKKQHQRNASVVKHAAV